jgi:GMP synthase-like glutamine amidotransferase
MKEKNMRIHYLQHVPFEDLGSIYDWANHHAYHVTCTRLYENDSLPEQESFDWLIVMGGPMNIYEDTRYPWLLLEKRFIESAIAADKVVIGICLGAQLLADVSGARVYGNIYKEIGWFPIQFTDEARQCALFRGIPSTLEAFHWHGDTFDLPRNAVRLAYSEACAQQGFLVNDRVLGFQFHLETTPRNAQRLIDHCRDELVDAPWIHTADEMLVQDGRFQRVNRAMWQLLDQLVLLNEA